MATKSGPVIGPPAPALVSSELKGPHWGCDVKKKEKKKEIEDYFCELDLNIEVPFRFPEAPCRTYPTP